MKNLIIFDFDGLGNALLNLPLLVEMEKKFPNISYFCQENLIYKEEFFIDKLKLKKLKGCFPKIWGRFEKQYLQDILDYIKLNQIDTLINFRNLGLDKNSNYIDFKNNFNIEEFKFIDFYTKDNKLKRFGKPTHIVLSKLALLNKEGINIEHGNPLWLKDIILPSSQNDKKIALFTGASKKVKLWDANEWIRLISFLLKHTTISIDVHIGFSEDEIFIGKAIKKYFKQIHKTKISNQLNFISGLSFIDFCRSLSNTSLIITNDTSTIHIGSALGIPVIGLYLSTSATIWGGFSNKFIAVQSPFTFKCPDYHSIAGNCNFYFEGCPAPCKADITAEIVFQKVIKVIKNLNNNF